MAEKEKYMGEARLIDKIKSKLNLIIKPGAITTTKIADKAVTADKLGDHAIDGRILAENCVGNDQLNIFVWDLTNSVNFSLFSGGEWSPTTGLSIDAPLGLGECLAEDKIVMVKYGNEYYPTRQMQTTSGTNVYTYYYYASTRFFEFTIKVVFTKTSQYTNIQTIFLLANCQSSWLRAIETTADNYLPFSGIQSFSSPTQYIAGYPRTGTGSDRGNILPFTTHAGAVVVEWMGSRMTLHDYLLRQYLFNDHIDELIPAQATVSNKLADKNFVNSSISTNTADFVGLYDSYEELEEAEISADKNDYAFVRGVDSLGNTRYDRYKWGSRGWMLEYTLNNSSFTAEQWATINSGITAETAEWLNNLVVDISTAQSYTNNGGRVYVWADEPVSEYTTYVEEGDTHNYWHMVFRNSQGYIKDFSRDTDSASDGPYTLDASYTWNSAPARIKSLFFDESVIKVTYEELLSLRAAEKLVPGVSYRITDYTTSCGSSVDVEIGDARFDIIVTAIDSKTLGESAKAARHDSMYFPTDTKFEAWELKYCLDNDRARFDWADDSYTTTSVFGTDIDDENEMEFLFVGEDTSDLYIWRSSDNTEVFTTSRNPEVGDTLLDDPLERDTYGTITSTNVTHNGKGVIYYMKDEYRNECSYDFKSIKFKKTIESANYFYTFTYVDEDGIIVDASVFMQGREGNSETGVYDNIIYSMYKSPSSSASTQKAAVMSLGANVFAHYYLSLGNFKGFKSNVLEESCHDNVFYGTCSNNTLKAGCYSNYFTSCSCNTLGMMCYSNQIKQGAEYNTIGNSSHNCKIQENCQYNEIGSACNNVEVGYESRQSSYNKVIGNSEYVQLMGNRNVIGSNASYVTISGNYINVGSNCAHVSTSKCTYLTVESGNKYIVVTTDQSSARNITVAKGYNNSTTTKTITHPTSGDTFETVYYNTHTTVDGVVV